MTSFREQIEDMSPERFARAAKRAAELAVELAGDQPVPDRLRRLAESTEDEIRARWKRREWIGDPPFASEWTEHMRSLLGKWVNVTIDKEKPVVVTGKLLSFNEGGEVAIRHDDGFVTWAWPALEAEESDPLLADKMDPTSPAMCDPDG